MKGVNSNPFVVIHFNIVIPINNVAIAHFEAENIADLEIEDKINFFLHQISKSYSYKQSFLKNFQEESVSLSLKDVFHIGA